MQASRPEDAVPTLIDQGDNDPFLAGQLQPAVLAEVARQKAWPLTLRIQPGYDHSYYFIASFIEDHLRFHAQHLLAKRQCAAKLLRGACSGLQDAFSAGNQKR